MIFIMYILYLFPINHLIVTKCLNLTSFIRPMCYLKLFINFSQKSFVKHHSILFLLHYRWSPQQLLQLYLYLLLLYHQLLPLHLEFSRLNVLCLYLNGSTYYLVKFHFLVLLNHL